MTQIVTNLIIIVFSNCGSSAFPDKSPLNNFMVRKDQLCKVTSFILCIYDWESFRFKNLMVFVEVILRFLRVS